MSFFALLIGCFLLYEFDGKIYGRRRVDAFKKKLTHFQENGLGMYLNTHKQKQVAVYEDKQLTIHISKKKDRIEIKVFLRSLLRDKDLVQHIIYDEKRHVFVQDLLDHEYLEEYWGKGATHVSLFTQLRPLLIHQVNEWFDTDIPVNDPYNMSHTTSSDNPKKTETPMIEPISERLPIAELESLLQNGKFAWSEENGTEIYTTIEGDYTLELNKTTEDNHAVKISRNGIYLVRFQYHPHLKTIQDLDVHKTLLHNVKDPEQFVSLLEKVLFFCYEKTQHKQVKIERIIERFNQKPYVFLEKEKEMLQRIDFIKEHRALLSTEDAHLFDTIQSEKWPEIMAFKQNMTNDHSIETELIKMMSILTDVLDNLTLTIHKKQALTFQVKERLIEHLKQDKD